MEPKFRSALEGDVDQTLSDISSISKEIGWKPTIKLEDWLKTIITTEEIDDAIRYGFGLRWAQMGTVSYTHLTLPTKA